MEPCSSLEVTRQCPQCLYPSLRHRPPWCTEDKMVVRVAEKRACRRVRFSTPLRLRVWKAGPTERRAESIDLSESGALLATEETLPIGSSVEILLKMPEQITGRPTTEWRCTGHVVRAQSLDPSQGKQAFGVEFDYYEILRSKSPMHT